MRQRLLGLMMEVPNFEIPVRAGRDSDGAGERPKLLDDEARGRRVDIDAPPVDVCGVGQGGVDPELRECRDDVVGRRSPVEGPEDLEDVLREEFPVLVSFAAGWCGGFLGAWSPIL